MTNGDEWPIPQDLSPMGTKAAELIHAFMQNKDILDHGGGGRFWSPAEWAARGERYGLSSLLIVTHDGGDHAGAFNLDYEQYHLNDELGKTLEHHGLWMEACTNWYTAIYPRP